jgi:hypothetical protein
MAHLEVFFFTHRGVVVFWTASSVSNVEKAMFADLLFLWMTNARSSGVKNLAVSGKSTKTAETGQIKAWMREDVSFTKESQKSDDDS